MFYCNNPFVICLIISKGKKKKIIVNYSWISDNLSVVCQQDQGFKFEVPTTLCKSATSELRS